MPSLVTVAVLVLCTGNRFADCARTRVRGEDLRTAMSRPNEVPPTPQLENARAHAAVDGSGPFDVSAAEAARANRTVYVGVISAPVNVDKRNKARERWLTAARERFTAKDDERPRVRLEFIIGRQPINSGMSGREQGALATDGELSREKLLVSEEEIHGDIYRIPAAESYAELPGKVLLMLGRAVEGGYDFVVKVDDDVHLDIDEVLSTIDGADPHDPLYAGPFRWDHEEFAEQAGANDEFVPYFGGPCYLLSGTLAERIAREHLGHSVAYNSYGSTSQDLDMGRWVAYEDQLFVQEGAKTTTFQALDLCTEFSSE